jgi:glycosyltransferase involved in cell wall biosynthesis
MNAIDVMALPSHREPCALVYVEAALLGKPILACRAGGSPELVVHGETGLLVTVKNGGAIAQALCEFLDNPGRARAMGVNGSERARELFGWSRYVRAIEGVYDRLLDQPSSVARVRSRRAA